VVGVDAVREAVALSGGAVPALRTALAGDPAAGVERALLALAVGADYSDAVLRDQLIRAYADAAEGREKSLPQGLTSLAPNVPRATTNPTKSSLRLMRTGRLCAAPRDGFTRRSLVPSQFHPPT
jgi:hypothetical protein